MAAGSAAGIIDINPTDRIILTVFVASANLESVFPPFPWSPPGKQIMRIAALVFSVLTAASQFASLASSSELEDLKRTYQRWWGSDLIVQFDALPTEGTVPKYRIPYSGHIYPDTGGGTMSALTKYDRAFSSGRYAATGFERWDTSAFQEEQFIPQRGGLFGFGTRMVRVSGTPYWHGHCNGWTAAAIRHAEPQQNVVRNGVTFTPADIKALLAEIYMYRDTDNVAGESGLVNPASLHLVLTNWLGRHSHPVAMEAMPGREKWNYPIYAFGTSHAKRGNQVEVKLKLRYAQYSSGEHQQSPRIAHDKYFHYTLNLNEHGEIVSGSYFSDSSQIDLLWLPLPPVQGKTPGNERGNPHVDVSEVLAIWRASVPEELASKWVAPEPKPDAPEPKPDAPASATAAVETADVANPTDAANP